MLQHIRMDIVADHHTDYCLLNDDGSHTWSIPECSKQSSGNGSQGLQTGQRCLLRHLDSLRPAHDRIRPIGSS
jgi:hypothetical protein